MFCASARFLYRGPSIVSVFNLKMKKRKKTSFLRLSKQFQEKIQIRGFGEEKCNCVRTKRLTSWSPWSQMNRSQMNLVSNVLVSNERGLQWMVSNEWSHINDLKWIGLNSHRTMQSLSTELCVQIAFYCFQN